ncbi:MAG: alpha/beta hydrolase [Epsilonproteobacteria bacterium]|nr:alpha/beta hydrolase [Campylobacterota bacterium]
MKKVALFLLFFSLFLQAAIKETIHFKSLDGVTITADLYIANLDKRTPFIVLFHRAGWSRGEYGEIAQKLNALGFNCMAVDLRSGGEVLGVKNETKLDALLKHKPTTYIDAMKDIKAALLYARKHFAKGKLIAWGSSYSAALIIKMVADQKELADEVVSFSPGEYFTKFDKAPDWIKESAKKLRVPIFITSAKKEQSYWKPIYDVIHSKKYSYLPKTKGHHGSSSLWSRYSDSTGYWQAVKGFLRSDL